MTHNDIETGSNVTDPESRIQDYEKLVSIIQTIGASLDVDEVLQRITQGVMQICDAYQVSIILFDPSENDDRTLIREGESKELLLDHYLNLLLSGWVRRNGKPLLSDKLWGVFSDAEIKEKYQSISSVLSVPLNHDNEMLGSVNVISTRRERPMNPRDLKLVEHVATSCSQFIVNARLHQSLFEETERLRKSLREDDFFHGIIGKSPAMKKMFHDLERIIPTEGRVLLEGESGTGKELVTRILHQCGPRKEGPFVAVDCGALPPNLMESELFGYVKGAFTGAFQDKTGLFEEAHGGTLFLDEISNMTKEVQSKLLRVIEEGELRPVGSSKIKKVDVRIVAAASDNLLTHIKDGGFREDLYYRLNVLKIILPPLRERKEDIPVLANHFLQQLADKYQKNARRFHPDTMIHCERYDWPGNVRELENAVERMVILAGEKDTVLHKGLLPMEVLSPHTDSDKVQLHEGDSRFKSEKGAHERQLIRNALSDNDWNQSAAARSLGIPESTLRYKMKTLGIIK